MADIYRVGWANSLGWLFKRTDWKEYRRSDGSMPYVGRVLNIISDIVNGAFAGIESGDQIDGYKEEIVNHIEAWFPKGWMSKFWDEVIVPNWESIPEMKSVFDELFPQDVNDQAYSVIRVYQYAPTGHVLESFAERGMPGTKQKKYETKFRTIYDKRPYYISSMTLETTVRYLVSSDRIANLDFYGEIFGNALDAAVNSDDDRNIYALVSDFMDDFGGEMYIDIGVKNGITLLDMELSGTFIANTFDDLLKVSEYTGNQALLIKYTGYSPDGQSGSGSAPLDISANFSPSNITPETIDAVLNVLLETVHSCPYDASAKLPVE